MVLGSDVQLTADSVESATLTGGTGNQVKREMLQFLVTDALFATGEEYVPELAA